MCRTFPVLFVEKKGLGCAGTHNHVLNCLYRPKETPMNEEERDEMYWAIHQDQDDRGWFDEPWWLGMEPYDEDAPF